MSRCEDIDNAIWDDPEFESLSPYATLLYLWSFTNPRCDWSGMYKVSHRGMGESKVPLDAIPAALAELAEGRFAFYEDNVLWVRARVKRLQSRGRSPQMAKAVVKDLRRVGPGHVLMGRWMEEYSSDPWLRDALAEGYREGTDTLSEPPVSKPDSDTLSPPYRRGAGKGEGKGEGTSEKVELPEDFPRELRLHLRVVFKVLRDVAVRHNAKAVTPLSLVAVVMARTHKPLVRGVYDFAAWADGQAMNRRDVLAGYRNWLDKLNDLAGFEQLGADGLPANGRVPPLKGNASSMLRDMGFGFADEPVDGPDVVDAEVVEEDAA